MKAGFKLAWKEIRQRWGNKMLKGSKSIKLCMLSFILALFLVSASGCVWEYAETADTAKDNAEALKQEAAELQERIGKVKETKANSNMLTNEDKQKLLKELEEQETKLLEQSKELEEKIKELQQKEN